MYRQGQGEMTRNEPQDAARHPYPATDFQWQINGN